MTTKGKIIVGISALVILSGAGYLIYKFVIKPAQDKKKEPVVPDAPTTTTNTNNSGSTSTSNNTNNSGSTSTSNNTNNSGTNTTKPPAPVSKYGFMLGQKLYSKNSSVPVYQYPDTADPNNYIGFVKKSATSKLTYAGDANTNGWIKALAYYLSKDGSGKENVSNVYVLATTVTNVAP